MDYRELIPGPALRPYVRCYWTLEAQPTDGAGPQRVLPDGCVEIIVNLGDAFVRHDESGRVERQPRGLIVGPTTRHMSIAPTGQIRLVGIRFSPGGAVPFLSVAPQELRDTASAASRGRAARDRTSWNGSRRRRSGPRHRSSTPR